MRIDIDLSRDELIDLAHGLLAMQCDCCPSYIYDKCKRSFTPCANYANKIYEALGIDPKDA